MNFCRRFMLLLFNVSSHGGTENTELTKFLSEFLSFFLEIFIFVHIFLMNNVIYRTSTLCPLRLCASVRNI